MINLRPSLHCPTCNVEEDICHIVIQCSKYTTERNKLFDIAHKELIASFRFEDIIFTGKDKVLECLTELVKRYECN
ncbi:hypothetical protein O3M35_007135 [Rhynocoris fuscipes]|uniref:Reverse transcriptase n=1 Tax=Rhynocoris fuscipes TaxID=488301 RepID=A0AAW1D887_9HEMI